MIQENGFFEVFVNNEAQTPVFFDNLVVSHTPSQILEVNTYYPYGMLMQGSDMTFQSAIRDEWNGYKYNAQELQTELELGWLDYVARMLDPFLGRWFVPDPLAEKYYNISPYAYALNNPIKFIDPDGKSVDDFYFDENGDLLNYVINDNPDRVFIASGQTKVDTDIMIPIPSIEQVEMSTQEIEQRMNNNGYKKVTKEETVVTETMTIYYTDADGGVREPMNEKKVVNVLEQKKMFVPKDKTIQNIKEEYLYNMDRIHKMDYKIEKNVEKLTYDYNRKNTDHSKEVNKFVQFVFQIIGGKPSKSK